MAWPFNDNEPIYLQIIQIIKSKITAGTYPAGEKLLSVRDLAMEAGVNPNTMQRALSELERDGFLYSQRTAGRFITEDKEKIERALQELAYQQIEKMVTNIMALGCQREQIILLVREYLDAPPSTSSAE